MFVALKSAINSYFEVSHSHKLLSNLLGLPVEENSPKEKESSPTPCRAGRGSEAGQSERLGSDRLKLEGKIRV